MPLFKRQTFKGTPAPKDLAPDDEVFFCPLTKEIFKTYDEYFTRHIVLNSLVWTCSATGKTGLTFEEAQDSEKHAQKTLDTFPDYLMRPVLFLVSLTHRSRLDDLVSDIWTFTKDRYLIGERVELTENNTKAEAIIVSVYLHSEANYDLVATQSGKKNREELKAVDSTSFRYNLKMGDEQIRKGIAVDTFSRPKGVYKKERLKLFVKHWCELEKESWKFRPEAASKYNLSSCKFSDIFAGAPPIFPRTGAIQKKSTDNTKSIEAELSLISETTRNSPTKANKTPGSPTKRLTKEFKKSKAKQEEELQVILQSIRTLDVPKVELTPLIKCDYDKLLTSPQMNDLRAFVKFKKEQDKDKKREERRLQEEIHKEWKKPREDLMCDDLKPLPDLTPISMDISAGLFGDILALHEYFHTWWGNLQTENVSLEKEDMTMEYICEAIRTTNPNGGLVEFIQILLQTVFYGQESEDGDEISLDQKEELAVENCDVDNKLYSDQIKQAIKTAEDARETFGVSIRNLHFDSLCATEVLRLHLQSSGYYTGSNTSRFRYCNRGGFRCWDDYGLLFRKSHPELVEKLGSVAVYSLSVDEKILIVNVLCDQALTFNHFRKEIDNRLDKVEQYKKDMRQMRARDLQHERDATVNKSMRDNEQTLANLQQTDKEKALLFKQTHNITLGRPKPSKYTKRLRTYLQNLKEGSVSSGRRLGHVTDDGVDVLDEVNFDELELDEIVVVRDMQRDKLQTEYSRMTDLILETQMATGQTVLIGRDRMYRKYYLLLSLPALLIEIGNEHIEALSFCNQPTPVNRVNNKQNISDAQLRLELGACTGDIHTCPVHTNSTPQHTWYYLKADQVINLVNALNPRGFREMDLLMNLDSFKTEIQASISKMPDLNDLVLQRQPAGSDQTSNVQDLLIGRLLEMEEEISVGGLGELKMPRQQWRHKITAANNTESVDVLRQATRELAEGLHLKFITGLYSNKNSDGELCVTDNFKRWLRGIDECGSHSQIAVYLSSLEVSVEWKKSKLKQRCRMCRKKGESTNMALCCKCSLTTHTFCMKPPIKQLPGLQWKCADCVKQDRAREAKIQRQKQMEDRKKEGEEKKKMQEQHGHTNGISKRSVKLEYQDIFDASSSSQSSDDESTTFDTKNSNRCSDCKGGLHPDKNSRVDCAKCAKTFHCACVSLTKRPTYKWTCRKCPKVVIESDESSDENEDCEKNEDGDKKTYEETFVIKALNGDLSRRKRSATNNIKPYEKRRTLDDDFLHDEKTKALMLGLRGDKAARSKELAQCQRLIEEAMRHEDAWPFDKPVNKNDVPDYYNVIRNPMDLRTMMNKLKRHDYEKVEEVVRDYKTIFNNCRQYNEPKDDVYKCGAVLEGFMDGKLMELGLDAGLVNSASLTKKRRTK